MTVESILSQAEELSLEERAELFRRLETSLLDAGWQPEPAELSPYVRNMLDERIRSSDANPDAGVPWEDVLAAARKRWGK